MERLADIEPASGELGVGRLDVGDHEVQALVAPRFLRRHADPEGDRAGGPGRRELHDPEAVVGLVVDVADEPALVGVERLGAIDVRHREHDRLELVVHLGLLLLADFFGSVQSVMP